MLHRRLRVKFRLGNRATEFSESRPLLQYKKYIGKYGIDFVEDKPDITLIHHRLLKEKDLNNPVIILERADSSSLYQPVTRTNISHPNVKAVFKTTTLRDKKLHNSDTWSGRYHCSIINKYAKIADVFPPRTLISTADLEKIRVAIPTSMQDRFIEYKGFNIDRSRDIDVSFVGVTKYDGFTEPNLINWHREQAVAKLQKIKGIKIFVATCGSNEQAIDPREYKKIVLRSKICLSPWGMGEWNYRDFHSMYTGAILLKPNSNHVLTYPVDIFQPDRYVSCSPSFDDLEKKIYNIISNWENFRDMRIKNNRDLIQSWNWDKRSKEFADLLLWAFKRKL